MPDEPSPNASCSQLPITVDGLIAVEDHVIDVLIQLVCLLFFDIFTP